MSTVDGKVRCRPRKARLPARFPVDLRVLNSSDRPITFAAPKLFKASRSIRSEGFTLDVTAGGFTVAPNSRVRVVIETPRTGEYYYSCFEPGRMPTTQSSGYLILLPPANR